MLDMFNVHGWSWMRLEAAFLGSETRDDSIRHYPAVEYLCYPLSENPDRGHPLSVPDRGASQRCFMAAGLWSLVQGDVGRGVCRAVVVGAGADEAVVVELLDDVRGPAGDAAEGKDGGVEIDVDAEGGVG